MVVELPVTTLYMGWGFKSDAQAHSFASCWSQTGLQWPPQGICCAVLKTRLDTPAWQALQDWVTSYAPQVQSQAQWWMGDEVEIAQTTTPSHSERVMQRFATGSVSEALALQVASHYGPSEDISLLLPRIVSEDRRATLAIATVRHPSSLLQTGVHS